MKSLKLLSIVAVVGAAVLVSGGCAKDKAKKEEAHAEAHTPPTTVSIHGHQHHHQSPIKAPMLKHVKTQEDFDALAWRKLQPASFDRQDMILVAMGEQPTGGYWVRITDVYQIGDEVIVRATVNRPGEGQAVPQVVTQPFCIVTVPSLGDDVMIVSDFISVQGQAMPE